MDRVFTTSNPPLTGLQQIPEFATGQVLGRALYRTLFDNDNHLNGYADRPQTVAMGSYHATNQGVLEPFDGYIYLDATHFTLHYFIAIDSLSADESAQIDLYFDYGGDDEAIIATVISDVGYTSETGTVDLDALGYAPGLYRVKAVVTVPIDDAGCESWCAAPWLAYDGAEAYAAGVAVADGGVPTAANFNTWRSNDLWFAQQICPNPVHVNPKGLTKDTGYQGIPWIGWVCAPSAGVRVHYKFETLGNARVDGYFHTERFVTVDNAPGIYEGTFDLVGAWTEGSAYKVYWEVWSAGANELVSLYYTEVSPIAVDAAWEQPTELAVHQYVFGDTAGETTRADLLTDNDAALAARSGLVYRQYATQIALDAYDGIDLKANAYTYRLRRQGNTLYYRTLHCELTYGDQTVALVDYTAGSPYQTLDLNTLDELLPGMEYDISQDGTAGGELAWAMEV